MAKDGFTPDPEGMRKLQRQLEKKLRTKVPVQAGDTEDTLAARISAEPTAKGAQVHHANVRELARKHLDGRV